MKNINKIKCIKTSVLLPILTIFVIGSIALLVTSNQNSWSYNWNGVSESIKDSVLVIKDIAYTGGTGSNGNSMRKYVDKRLWIMNNATENELLNLIKYPNGTVKALGYEGLIRKNDFKNKSDLIIESLNDNEYKVYYSMGCDGIELSVSEYLIQWFLKIDNTIIPFKLEQIIDYGLTKGEKEKILTEFHTLKK